MAARTFDVTDEVTTGAGWRRARAVDGTPIAWRVDGPPPGVGRRPTPIVLCNGIACSTDYWPPLAAQLARSRPVVQWDYRGHGRSGTPPDIAATTIDDVLADLGTVLAAAGTERAVLVGHSFGVQVAIEAVRRRPERAAAVVAIAGAAGHPLPDAAITAPVSPLELVRRAHDLEPNLTTGAWRRWWTSPLPQLLAQVVGGTSLAAPPSVMRAYYRHVSTRDVSVLLAMMRAMQAHDATAAVPQLEVPLLVLAGDADRLTSLPTMVKLALAAPDGELAVCHGGTHTLPIEHPTWISEQLAPLLARVDAVGAAPEVAATGA